jgi:hypothetical protein
MLDLFKIAGLTGIVVIILFIILLPLIATIIVGIAFANILGFTGITWWAFLIVFYLIVSGIISLLSR